MLALLCFARAVLASPFKSKSRLEAENAALRHHLVVLRRQSRGQARLTNSDRWFFVQLYRWHCQSKFVYFAKTSEPDFVAIDFPAFFRVDLSGSMAAPSI